LKPALDKQFTEPYLKKYPTQKRAGRVAQVVEHLPSNCEAPSSNPVPPPKNKKKKNPSNNLKYPHVRILKKLKKGRVLETTFAIIKACFRSRRI
jgi:hypothetical protein